MRVYVLDEILVKPGMAGAYRQAYRKRYMPGARRRGMRLDGAWRHPPVEEYEGVPVTLYYLWSLESVEAWWAMRRSKTPDGADERYEKLAWWQDSDDMTLSRSRKFLSALAEAE